jgi:hypothetical protein
VHRFERTSAADNRASVAIGLRSAGFTISKAALALPKRPNHHTVSIHPSGKAVQQSPEDLLSAEYNN